MRSYKSLRGKKVCDRSRYSGLLVERGFVVLKTTGISATNSRLMVFIQRCWSVVRRVFIGGSSLLIYLFISCILKLRSSSYVCFNF